MASRFRSECIIITIKGEKITRNVVKYFIFKQLHFLLLIRMRSEKLDPPQIQTTELSRYFFLLRSGLLNILTPSTVKYEFGVCIYFCNTY